MVFSSTRGRMKTRVKWIDNMSFVAESGSGHSVVMDGAADSGGRNLGIRPMEMVLSGLGGCAAFDVVLILKKSKQNIYDVQVHLSAQRAEDIPQVFSSIHAVYDIYGSNLSEKQVNRAVQLSVEKYCSVSAMLEKTAKMTYKVNIIDRAKAQ
jgi:putative redox protein